MDDYKKRVASESKELDDKIRKLGAFTEIFAFSQLPHTEQDILRKQLTCMEEYAFILHVRLWNWMSS